MPDDTGWIYRQMRARSPEERAAIDTVLAEFFKSGRGKIWNPRLLEIFEEISDKTCKRSDAGKAGAAAKAMKRKNKDASNAEPLLKQPEPEPKPEPKVVVAAAAPPQDPTDRERLLAAMGVGPDGLTGPSGFIGTQVDMAEAAKWSALGLSISEQCAVIAENCTRQRASNRNWMPRRFGYFTGAMADLAAKKSQPVPTGASQPQSRDDQIAKWKRIAGQ